MKSKHVERRTPPRKRATKRALRSDKASLTREPLVAAPSQISIASKPEDFRRVRHSLGITQQHMQRLSGFSVRTLSALETGEKPPRSEHIRRFRELARLRRELEAIVSPDAIASWLETPNDLLRGASPIEAIERGEADRVWRLIWRIQDGVPLD